MLFSSKSSSDKTGSLAYVQERFHHKTDSHFARQQRRVLTNLFHRNSVPLTAEDREQFILDNQWSFKHGALMEFGERDNHIDDDGEIISRKTIESCIDNPQNETYHIVVDGKKVGGVILKIDKETNINELEILFTSPEEHSKGIGYGTWLAIEALYPETKIWKTCTPYFDKRNIHFYVNKCGFQIDEFWCEYFKPSEPMPDADEHDKDEGPDEMFHFIKVMRN